MKSNSAGFTIVELMITIAILSVLVMLSLPTFKEYMASLRIRTTAEAFLEGIQTARGEAIKSNGGIEFLITADTPSADNVATVALTAIDAGTGVTTGKNWMIRTTGLAFLSGKLADDAGTSTTSNPVEIQSWADSNRNNTMDTGEATVASITFGGFGNASFLQPDGSSTAGPVVLRFTNPTGGSCAQNGGTIRCLHIVINPGGHARMCDPAITTTGDTRQC